MDFVWLITLQFFERENFERFVFFSCERGKPLGM